MTTARTARPTLNFDAAEPMVSTDPNASALFPNQPVYARKPSRKTRGNLPLLVGAPVLAIVAGGLIWASMADHRDAPTDPASLRSATAATAAPKTATPAPVQTAETPAPAAKPTELASNAPATKAAPSTPRAQPKAATASRRSSASERAPDAESASANVSATVPASPPVVAAPAPVDRKSVV